MSNHYRDDIHEIIAYSNSTWGRQFVVAEEVIHVAEKIQSTVGIHTTELVAVADDVIDRRIMSHNEQVVVVDEFIGRKHHTDWVIDKIVVADRVRASLHAKTLIDDVIVTANSQYEYLSAITEDALNVYEHIEDRKHSASKITDHIKVGDGLNKAVHYRDNLTDELIVTDVLARHKIRSFMHEVIANQDTMLGTRYTQSTVVERIGIKDKGVGRFAQQIIEQVGFDERYSQRTFAVQYVVDELNLIEEYKQVRQAKQWVVESLTTLDQQTGKCYAKQLVNELLFLEDNVLGEQYRGFAWTANVDTWAMSRYQDYGFSELVVIDGVLYGVGADGLYRLDANSFVDAKLTTGQLDLGQGSLVHPLGAYLEYELSGNTRKLEIGVSTTQSGVKQTYTYNLPAEPSNYLTNGRVLFGRGLRGRHFAFEIKISGEHGYINDLSIDMTATKRRV